MRDRVEVEVTVTALSYDGKVWLERESVGEALRSIAAQLEAVGSVMLAPEQFREAGRLFERLPAPKGGVAVKSRRLFGRRRG